MTEEESLRIFGDVPMWTRYIPRAWRIVGDAPTAERFPSWLSPDDPERWQKAPAIFTAYMHLLRYRLGWNDVRIGILAWDRAGRPDLDPVLGLMNRLGGEGLDWFVGWLAHFNEGNQPAEAVRTFRKHAGGYDPWHLIPHSHGPAPMDPTTVADLPRPVWGKGIFACSTYLGWWDQLREAPEELWESPVEVYVQPIGWMGRYTKSAHTGRAHATDADTHLLGCLPRGTWPDWPGAWA